MEILKKPREPWEIGIDNKLVQPNLLPLFYQKKFFSYTKEKRFTNAEESLIKTFNEVYMQPSKEDKKEISNAICLRNELVGCTGRRSLGIWLLLSHIYDGRWQLDKDNDFSNIPEDEKKRGIHFLLNTSKEHNRLNKEAPTLEIPIGTEDLSMVLGYDAGNWEALGAVYIYLKNGDNNPVPSFVVRGNPLIDTTGNRAFEVNNIQGWISDGHASITGFKSLVHNKKYHEGVEEIDLILKRRDKLLNRLTTITDKHKNKNTRNQFIMLSSILYLSFLGIKSFRGIKHDLHPQILLQEGEPKKIHLNYDQLWNNLGFQSIPKSNDEIHPWQLDLSTGLDMKNFKTANSHIRQRALDALSSISDSIM